MASSAPDFPASPLGVGGTLSTAFNLAKRHLGLWLKLALAALGSALLVLAIAFGLAYLVVGLDRNSFGATLLFGLIFGVGEFAAVLISYRFYGAFYAAVVALSQGRRPTVSSSLQESKGFLLRSLVLFLILGALVVVASLTAMLLGVWLAKTVAAARLESGTAAMGFVLLVLATYFGVLVLSLYLQTKLYYLMPVLSVEGIGPVASLSRAWRLTKGEFWRTLGYMLLAGLIAMVPVLIFQFVVYPIGFLGFFGAISLSEQGDPSAKLFGILLLVVIVTVIAVLYLLLLAFIMLYSNVYSGVMYVDRVRRERGDILLAAYPVGGYPPAGPGGYPAPGYSPQPTPGYPAQPAHGYPAQPNPGYPTQPAAGYQPQADPSVPPAGLGDSQGQSAYPVQQPGVVATPEDPQTGPNFYSPGMR